MSACDDFMGVWVIENIAFLSCGIANKDSSIDLGANLSGLWL